MTRPRGEEADGQDFLAVFFAVLFFAADFVVAFLAGAFDAVLDALVLLLAALVDFAAVFLAGAALFAEVPVVFAALDFLVALDFFAADEVLLAVLLAVVLAALFVAVFLAGAAFFADVEALEDFFAADVPVPVTAAAAARTAAGGLGIVAAVRRGSFLAPETMSLSSLPAENFGTDFFFDFIRSPVCGLRTHRALRTALSKEPKPVIATFSPLATSRVMVSSTDSSACAACLRFPS